MKSPSFVKELEVKWSCCLTIYSSRLGIHDENECLGYELGGSLDVGEIMECKFRVRRKLLSDAEEQQVDLRQDKIKLKARFSLPQSLKAGLPPAPSSFDSWTTHVPTTINCSVLPNKENLEDIPPQSTYVKDRLPQPWISPRSCPRRSPNPSLPKNPKLQRLPSLLRNS